MNSHFLSELYTEMRETLSTETIDESLLTEKASEEQQWVEQNLIRPITQLIFSLNASRAVIPAQMDKETVLREVKRLEKLKHHFYEVWHNMGDRSQNIVSVNATTQIVTPQA